MKSLSIFSIGVFFTLAACSIDPTLAGRYPVWMYAAFISSQVLFSIALHLRSRMGSVAPVTTTYRVGPDGHRRMK